MRRHQRGLDFATRSSHVPTSSLAPCNSLDPLIRIIKVGSWCFSGAAGFSDRILGTIFPHPTGSNKGTSWGRLPPWIHELRSCTTRLSWSLVATSPTQGVDRVSYCLFSSEWEDQNNRYGRYTKHHHRWGRLGWNRSSYFMRFGRSQRHSSRIGFTDSRGLDFLSFMLVSLLTRTNRLELACRLHQTPPRSFKNGTSPNLSGRKVQFPVH